MDVVTTELGLLPPRVKVLRAVRGLLVEGKLRAGDAVPSERLLAEQLGVGRGVIRGVIAELRREGLIREGPGRGWLVSEAVGGESASGGLMSRTVVVVTSAPRAQPDHAQPGWAEHIAQGAIRAVRTSGRDAYVIDPFRMGPPTVAHLIAQRPTGVVVPEIPDRAEAVPVQAVQSLRDAGLPVVVYGGSPGLAGFDRVRSDHETGCAMLTRWLIGRGLRRVLCYWSRDVEQSYWGRGRRRGYERAMHEAGLEPLPLLRHASGNMSLVGVSSEEEQFEVRVRLHVGYLLSVLGAGGARASTVPEALLLMTDGIYFEVAAACRLVGLEPGRDILICGYDNYWRDVTTRKFEPSVPAATVDKRNESAGEELVRLLSDRHAGVLPEGPQERLVTPELIVAS